MKTDNRIKIRVFTGNLTGPYEDKFERNFNKAVLKAYLKGFDYFQFGKKIDGTPKMFFVPKDHIINPYL